MDKTKNRQNYDQQLLLPSVLRVSKKRRTKRKEENKETNRAKAMY